MGNARCVSSIWKAVLLLSVGRLCLENTAVTHGEAQGWTTYRPQNTVGMELPAGLVSPTGVAATSTDKLRSRLPALPYLQLSFVWKTREVGAKEGTRALMGTSHPYWLVPRV